MVPSRINATIQLWQTQLPMIKPYYAVKCNPSPLFLNYLFDKGVNFDCASERELLQIERLARATLPERVVYANPCKSGRDLIAAGRFGSPVTVVDSPEEVEKLAEQGYKGGALIRLAVDDSGSAMPFSSKFGAPITMIETIAGVAYRRGISLKGFSFHVGSGSADGAAHRNAMLQCAEGLPHLWGAGHSDATTIDIGGGFLPDEADFRRKALQIRGTAYEVLGQSTRPLKFIAEPGRFFAANAFDFFVQVIGKKRSAAKAEEWKYTVDDSIYGQFSNILFDQAKPTWFRVGSDQERRPLSAGTLFGRTCDSLDVIGRAAAMEELDVGDWLCFPRMGAYTIATASEFNGFPTPEVVPLEHFMCADYESEPATPAYPIYGLRHPNAVSVKTLMS